MSDTSDFGPIRGYGCCKSLSYPVDGGAERLTASDDVSIPVL